MSAKADDYYYNQLNKEQKKVYYAMKEGMLKMQDSFPVLKLSNKELSDIYFMIRMDCPEIFYSVKFSYRYYPDSTMVEFVPEYLFTKDKIREHRQAMLSRVKKLARQAEKLDEKGRELFIHDFIVNNVKYDKLKKEYSHEIIGALGNGVAVCEGIAKAVNFSVMNLVSGVLWRFRRQIRRKASSTVMHGMWFGLTAPIIIWMQRLTIRCRRMIRSATTM